MSNTNNDTKGSQRQTDTAELNSIKKVNFTLESGTTKPTDVSYMTGKQSNNQGGKK